MISREICGSVALAVEAVNCIAKPNPSSADLTRAMGIIDELKTVPPFGAIVCNALATPLGGANYYVDKYGCNRFCAEALSDLTVAIRTSGESAYQTFLNCARHRVVQALNDKERIYIDDLVTPAQSVSHPWDYSDPTTINLVAAE